MTGASAHLPRFNRRATDIFDLTRQIRPLGSEEPAPAPPADHVAEAEARGRRKAEEAARAELERVRAEDKADFDMRLAAARQEWAQKTADVLAERLAAGLASLSGLLTDRVARVLGPFLAKAIRERALDELTETVLALLHGGRHLSLGLRGPADLVERLGDRLGEYPHSVEHVEDIPDLRVLIDDTAVETQIGAWIARVEAALKGEPHG